MLGQPTPQVILALIPGHVNTYQPPRQKQQQQLTTTTTATTTPLHLLLPANRNSNGPAIHSNQPVGLISRNLSLWLNDRRTGSHSILHPHWRDTLCKREKSMAGAITRINAGHRIALAVSGPFFRAPPEPPNERNNSSSQRPHTSFSLFPDLGRPLTALTAPASRTSALHFLLSTVTSPQD